MDIPYGPELARHGPWALKRAFTRCRIDPRGSDEIVRKLRASGYAVTYRRSRGSHEVPDAITKAAVRWFLAR